MHASTPLPSPPLGCPIIFYPPFPYSHYPSSPLNYHRIPPLNSAPLRSTLLPLLPNPLIYPTIPSHPSPPLPYHTPSLLYHTLSPYLSSTPLPSPRQPSPTLPTLPSTPLPSPTLSYPLISSTPFPHLPSPRISSPPLPYPTTLLSRSPPLPSAPLSHHSLLSTNPLTWRTLSCHLPPPTPPISSPPLGHPFYPPSPTLLYSPISYPSLATPSAPLPYLSSHLLPFPTRGARWLSGRVSDSGARGPGFETYLRRVVSLSKTLYSPKVLVNYPGSDGSVPTWLKNCWLGR